MLNAIIIGKKLKELRKINKLTANEVSILLEEYNYPICLKTFYKWEQGTIKPDIETLKLLCHIYNISIEEIFINEKTKFISMETYEYKFLEMIRADKNYKTALILIAKIQLRS